METVVPLSMSSTGFTYTSLLKQESEIPLYQQIYANLRRAILFGNIQPGTKLPSTRVLAKHLNVSRNTVLNAYTQLLAEGCLVSEHGSGTFVAYNLDSAKLKPRAEAGLKPEREVLSDRAAEMMIMLERITRPAATNQSKVRAFREGIPALDMFPRKLWRKLIDRAWRGGTSELLFGGSYLPLCKAIAGHLSIARGISCAPEQVIIVTGSQMGISLAGEVLLNPGESVWVEDPGYPGAYGAFHSVAVKPIPVPLDDQGLSLQDGLISCPDARLAFVTPSHQFPLGGTMSFRRRLELLNWADRNDAWILEDDYDSEFRYTGKPLAALQAIDIKRRVFYLGTFSKVMYPALRLGYLVVPIDLIDAFRAARQFTIQYPPLLEQVALAEFISEGHFHRHIRRMRSLYEERQQALVEAAHRELAGLLEVESSESGMHLIGWLPENVDDVAASRKAAKYGIEVTPLSNFYFDFKVRSGLILGFAGIDQDEIKAGVLGLRQALM